MSGEISISELRLLLRLTNAFTLEVFRLYRDGRDFTDALILTALAPGEGRPISINAVAGSLGLPFETVRRRVKALVRDGVCETTADGVRLGTGYLASAARARMVQSVGDATEAFYHRLAVAGCLPTAARAVAAAPPADADEARTVIWRSLAEYMLRLTELILPNFESPALGFMILTVVWANTRGFGDGVRGGDRLDVGAYVDDTLRRPVRTSELAELLGLPYETTRRNLAVLVGDGRVVRSGAGYIVPAEVLARPNPAGALTSNLVNLNRLFATLSEAGVLARWVGSVPAAGRGAA